MKHRPTFITGPSMALRPQTTSLTGHWDDLTTLERVKMVLDYADHFLSLGLVTRQELDRLMATSESEWEYLSENHPDVLFTNINIQKEIRAQAHRDELKAALRAAFM